MTQPDQPRDQQSASAAAALIASTRLGGGLLGDLGENIRPPTEVDAYRVQALTRRLQRDAPYELADMPAAVAASMAAIEVVQDRLRTRPAVRVDAPGIAPRCDRVHDH